MDKVLVVLSGGQDSVTCLHLALSKYPRDSIRAITFDYGQRHKREIGSAIKVADLAGIKHEIIDVSANILAGTSPLIDHNKDVGQYESAETLPGGLEDTFVPSRNMLFLTIASNRAYVHGCNIIMTGVSQEDFGGYPDCRESFIHDMQCVIETGLDRKIKLETPLIHLNKKQTVELAVQMGDECLEALSFSHTCYNGQYPPCGRCHACLLRDKGFKEAGIVDPLIERANS